MQISDCQKELKKLLNKQVIEDQDIFDLLDRVECQLTQLKHELESTNDDDNERLIEIEEEIHNLKEVKEVLEEFDTAIFSTYYKVPDVGYYLLTPHRVVQIRYAEVAYKFYGS